MGLFYSSTKPGEPLRERARCWLGMPVATTIVWIFTTALCLLLLLDPWPNEYEGALHVLVIGILIMTGWFLLLFERLLRLAWPSGIDACPGRLRNLRHWLWSTSVLCALLSILSAWPGVLGGDVGILTSVVIFGCLSLGWLTLVLDAFLVVLLHRKDASHPHRSSGFVRTIALACGIALIVGTVIAIDANVPMRVLFPLLKRDLEDLATGSSLTEERTTKVQDMGRFVGPWYVDSWGHDQRGGLFFRTFKRKALNGTLSFGFARGANDQGSPFGDTLYELTILDSDWSAFFAYDGPS